MLNKIIDELETYFGDESDSFDIESLAHYIAFNLGCNIRHAYIFVKPDHCDITIEGNNIYDRETSTLEEAIALIKRYGFIEER